MEILVKILAPNIGSDRVARVHEVVRESIEDSIRETLDKPVSCDPKAGKVLIITSSDVSVYSGGATLIQVWYGKINDAPRRAHLAALIGEAVQGVYLAEKDHPQGTPARWAKMIQVNVAPMENAFVQWSSFAKEEVTA